MGERCSEIWYYGGFPVVFRDPECSGHLELMTYDLSAIREYNLSYMHELSRAQEQGAENRLQDQGNRSAFAAGRGSREPVPAGSRV